MCCEKTAFEMLKGVKKSTNVIGTNVIGTNVIGTNVIGTNVIGTNVIGTNVIGIAKIYFYTFTPSHTKYK